LGWQVGATLCAAVGILAPVNADEGGHPENQSRPARFEFWSGAEGHRRAWSIYAGTTAAPFGAIQEDGVRVRIVGGYGTDSYSGTGGVEFKGTTSFADALLGYHSQLGPLTVKVFAGLTAADRQIRPADPAANIHGTGLGGKVQLETWWNLGDRAWTAVDLSWGSLHQSYAGRARLGWRLLPELSAGIEAGAVGDVDCGIVRAAAFVRYELAGGEMSVSGGVANDRLLDGKVSPSAAGASTPFAMLSWLTRF
jgi:hypothetical protein